MSTQAFIPKINPEIWEMFPDFFIASIIMRGVDNKSIPNDLAFEFADQPDKALIDETC